jgi:DNA/RNA-binding domain of Phe-tRNA-synthetase-like protein
MIEISDTWRSNHPGAALGVLTMRDVQTLGDYAQFNHKKNDLEAELRERYKDKDRSEILKVPEMQAYAAYYKRFKKTYHLLLQLESITHKNKSIPQGPLLVQAMFMAELNSLLLTAGHDLDQTRGQISLDSSTGEEIYTLLRNEEATCKTGDMAMSDEQGIFCTVIYGQDLRTRITKQTKNVLYAVYVPPGITAEVIEKHLSDLEDNVHMISPEAETEFSHIYFADSANPAAS